MLKKFIVEYEKEDGGFSYYTMHAKNEVAIMHNALKAVDKVKKMLILRERP